MHGISPSQFMASVSLLKRVHAMAVFIATEHPGEFRKWWGKNWTGKARADETLKFFSDPGFPSSYYLMRTEGNNERTRS